MTVHLKVYAPPTFLIERVALEVDMRPAGETPHRQDATIPTRKFKTGPRLRLAQDFLRREGVRPETTSPQRERNVVTKTCSPDGSTASGASASATESAMW